MTRIPALGPRGEGWVLIQIVLILLVAVAGALSLPAARERWPDNVPFVITGGILLIAGAFIIVSAVRRLGDSRTAFPRPRQDAILIQDGPYARIRHPIYVGICAMGVGWAVATQSIPAAVFVAGLAVVLDLKARREEVWLAERYPEYRDYRSRTHRFVPGVY